MPRKVFYARRPSVSAGIDIQQQPISGWGLDLNGSLPSTDNYNVKVMNQRKVLPQMKSDGGNPFFFGGSQVPHSLSNSYIFAQ